jgi:hypothetical protein
MDGNRIVDGEIHCLVEKKCAMADKPVRSNVEVDYSYFAQTKEKQMIKFLTLIAAMTMLSLFSGTEALAQKGITWKGGGGWGAGTPYSRMYNPKTVETISGEVVSIDKITPMKDMYYGVHAVIKTDKETISVHLGPGWYIENQDVKIAPKDKIEVKGSRITFEGKPAIIAAEVKKGDDVLMLRDAGGLPAWSGWRRR